MNWLKFWYKLTGESPHVRISERGLKFLNKNNNMEQSYDYPNQVRRYSEEEVIAFMDWAEKYFGRSWQNGQPLPWYSYDDLLQEEPLTTVQLLAEFLKTSKP